MACAAAVSLPILTACDAWKSLRPPDPGAMATPATRTPLPDTAFKVRWDAAIPAEMTRGSEADLRISFTNLGDAVWPDVLAGDPQKRDGSYAVRLAYGWSAVPSDPAWRPGARAELPHPVHPGETLTLLVRVVAPAEPGRRRLVFELVQELVVWFDTRGAARLVVPVTIQ